jgi:hypothetical protein
MFFQFDCKCNVKFLIKKRLWHFFLFFQNYFRIKAVFLTFLTKNLVLNE